jgi:hypothetical protein
MMVAATALQRRFAFGTLAGLDTVVNLISAHGELMEVIDLIVHWILTIKIDCWCVMIRSEA